MNVLAIETATAACAVGLATANGLELTRVMVGERHHNEVLVATIADLLGQAKLRPRDVERVVVDHGPGLFTGLRVGVATGIAFSKGVGAALVEVSSLELFAYGAWRDGARGEFVAVVDARRGELFVQHFHLTGEVRAVGPAYVTTPEALLESWRVDQSPTIFAGDGLARYADVLADLVPTRSTALSVPPVLEALRLGVTREVVATVTPLYLREPNAVVNFSTRERS